MWLFNKKSVKKGAFQASDNNRTVSIGAKPAFVAAYSTHPFAEADMPSPTYSFYSENGVNWCVRVGKIYVPWGFSARDCGFSANGFLVLERARVSALTLEKTGFRFTEEDGAFYLYETVADDNGALVGFCPEIRQNLLPCIKKLAQKCGKDNFLQEINSLTEWDEVNNYLSPAFLRLIGVQVNNIQ